MRQGGPRPRQKMPNLCRIHGEEGRNASARERGLSQEGIRVSILTAPVPPHDQREAWYERELRNGMQVCVAHPRLVSVGMDLLWAPSIYFVQTGYSIYTLRQASRRSWRIGRRSQRRRVFPRAYNETMQNIMPSVDG